MEELSKTMAARMGYYSLLLGIGYAASGLLQVAENQGALLGALPAIGVMLVLSATYLMGSKALFAGRRDGLSFILGGMLLSGTVGVLYLIMTGADGLLYLLGESEGFSMMAFASPATVLMVFALPLLKITRRLTSRVVW